MARKLRKYVIPSLLGSIGLGCLIGTPLYVSSNDKHVPKYKYTISENKDTNKIIPVFDEIEENKPLKPFLEETVGKAIDYYSINDDDTEQENSLVYYDNTFMPSTGILYSSEEPFDVICVLDGRVTKVSDDNILGKYVEVEHDNGYKTTYYSLSETNVTVGTQVSKGDVLGLSGTNKLEGILTNNLLFETYQNGVLQDPEDFYNIDFNKTN